MLHIFDIIKHYTFFVNQPAILKYFLWAMQRTVLKSRHLHVQLLIYFTLAKLFLVKCENLVGFFS